ncbi:MAG: hypothetical protein WB562_13155 [Candidatus Sulfotelmatobacter sp.]
MRIEIPKNRAWGEIAAILADGLRAMPGTVGDKIRCLDMVLDKLSAGELTIHQKACDCADRGWCGDTHDSACDFAGRPRTEDEE